MPEQTFPEALKKQEARVQLTEHMRELLKPLEGILDDEHLDYVAENGVHYYHTFKQTAAPQYWDDETPLSWVKHALAQDLEDRDAARNFEPEQMKQMWNFQEGRPIDKAAFDAQRLGKVLQALDGLTADGLGAVIVAAQTKLKTLERQS